MIALSLIFIHVFKSVLLRPTLAVILLVLMNAQVLAAEERLLTVYDSAPPSVMALFGYQEQINNLDGTTYHRSHFPVAAQPLYQHNNVYVGLAEPRPVIKIRVDMNSDYYKNYITGLIKNILIDDPYAAFEVVAVHPSRTSPQNIALLKRRSMRHAEAVMDIVEHTMNDHTHYRRLRMSTSPDLEVHGSEVHIYVDSKINYKYSGPIHGLRTDDGYL